MLVVLVKWVLKFTGVPVNLLRPGLLAGTTEYPAFHVFCFNDKKSIFGRDDMVNLSGSIFSWKGDIFDEMVVAFVQE